MKLTRFAAALLPLTILFSSITFAFETDQYNLPDTPLADSGEEISEYIFANLKQAITELNAEIAQTAACLESRTKDCDATEKQRKKLEQLRSEDAPAIALFKRIGDGNLFKTKFGRWLYSHQFRSSPSSYKAPYSESVFVLNLIDHATLSPTYRLYGVDLGGDKLEHLLQQGYDYYSKYRGERRKGRSEKEAVAKAISWGQRTERTYFGLLASGVYSNADLFANYAGLKFYLHLTEEPFGEPRVKPVLQLEDGRWVFVGEQDGKSFLKPFVTDHLNEALNPSSFRITLYRSVRRQVRKHACPKWKTAFLEMTRQSVDATTASLESWNGEDYGHTKRSRTVTIGDACFGDN
jgi:hypothetical protein